MSQTPPLPTLGIWSAPDCQETARRLSEQLGVQLGRAQATLVVDHAFYLELDYDEQKLTLAPSFTEGEFAWRHTHSTGKAEPVVKAIWGRNSTPPSVFDATAGLARDAFLLASSGCQVTAMEQHPLVYALIQNTIENTALTADEKLRHTIERITYLYGDSADYLCAQQNAFVDVIYLDPMFPPRPGSAKVKKEMQLLQALHGHQLGDELLGIAREKAKQKVVVKRPSYAPPLAQQKPSSSLAAGLNRFDIYPCA